MNLTALKIDAYLQYFVLIVMIIAYFSLFGVFLGVGLEISLGFYQCLHVLYFGFVLKKDWAKQHLINICIFIVVGCLFGLLATAIEAIVFLVMIYIILVPIAMAVWYCSKVKKHYKMVANLPTNIWEDEDILDAHLDQL